MSLFAFPVWHIDRTLRGAAGFSMSEWRVRSVHPLGLLVLEPPAPTAVAIDPLVVAKLVHAGNFSSASMSSPFDFPASICSMCTAWPQMEASGSAPSPMNQPCSCGDPGFTTSSLNPAGMVSLSNICVFSAR
jgi:hypothetical protein